MSEIADRSANGLTLGLDIGSTTVKAVLLAGEQVIFEDYRRHNADIRVELAKLLDDVAAARPGASALLAVTGSAGMGVADVLKAPFVQEVIAETTAVQKLDPAADVIIELGGEDGKITYLKPVPEQRMNGSCAGGTGAFIDQMATLLGTDAGGLNELAAHYTHLYPIASRCGVFAKSDIQPLLNDGAAHEDLAASIFQAVATQTIAELACGREIKGRVTFLGGPLHFLPELRAAFARVLEPNDVELVAPDRGQLMVALGAAMLAPTAGSVFGKDEPNTPVPLADLAERAAHGPDLANADTKRIEPLFATKQDREAFDARHAKAHVPQVPTEQADGACFLGIDAGSTTVKAVLIDEAGRICYSHYQAGDGDPVGAARAIVEECRSRLPETAIIARTCVTGYGEGLVKAALHIDDGEVETIAHYRAAAFLDPEVTSIIDIGGQDMKYLSVRDGVIDSICVNEACSSGCGSFLSTFAHTMGLDIETFAAAALASFTPVDLGSRCTVFMNSSVKQAQKEGASVGDIAAGLSYSVVRNALYKVIRLRDPEQLGDHIVVQGGTFLNDGVLRAFELLTGREVVRPDIAGLMGAFGAALIARSNFRPGNPSHLLSPVQLRNLTVDTSMDQCKLCQNHCQLTISAFPDGDKHVSGNRCERGGDRNKQKSSLPNLYDYKYKRVFGYRRLTEAKATRGDIGVPRVLNMYQDYPLWFTILTQLGFRVILSGRSSHDLFKTGMSSIASDNICYPAQLVHGHIEQLVSRGVRTIFYPCVSYEQHFVDGATNHYNCPVVAAYPQVIYNNVASVRQPGPDGEPVRFIHPYLNLDDRPKLVERLTEEFADWGVTAEEVRAAVEAGFKEDQAFRDDMKRKGEETLAFMRNTGTPGIVLVGRPYHVDPEIHHGIPELITGLGMCVLTEDSISHLGHLERPLRVQDQWSYHSRLYAAAEACTHIDGLELVQLNSFGCGLDAITTDEVAEIIRSAGQVYTSLKIDEVSNLGAARIRLRSLQAAARERRAGTVPDAGTPAALSPSVTIDTTGKDASDSGATTSCAAEPGGATASGTSAPGYVHPRRLFTKAMRRASKKKQWDIIAPQMSPVHFSLLSAAMRSVGYNVHVLEHALPEDVETGLKHVNNDACFPAIMVIGQLVGALEQGKYNPDRTAIMITQTGGMCRATNYVGMLRRGLEEAGFSQVPVIALSTQAFEKNPGFSWSLPLAHRAIKAVVIGDLLQTLLLRFRPYEVVKGSADKL
ncbi:MAG: acyl-CoA dehydratase activase-related protein, partial [Bifidobacteriaceae bacterium]|nr:acyl-CoA dehydratase activase-related protein [Bifidobacteriaceae bacterium]